MCAGAMTAVTTTGAGIGFGQYDVVIAGGVEHMGRHPMGLDADPNPRFLAERLVAADALNMGNTAERLHDRFPELTKERSDFFGMRSQQKVQAAYDAGHIQPDLVAVALRTEEGWGLADEDEGRRPETTLEGLATLKTPFRPHGRVTAGNASPLTDGATAAILASADAAKELGLSVKMRMVSFGFAGVEPEVMGIGPIPSTEKALKRAGLRIDDIGLFELNEAFAVQVLSFLDHFGIDDEDPRVNQWGGAIAIGHPLAASGVRLMIQLARQFEQHPEVRYGLTAMCVGLGQGGSVIWENPHHKRYGKGR
jgi:acetyl-CoA acyltransferase